MPIRQHGQLKDVVRRMEIVRLGEGVDRTGRFSPAALHRTLQAVDTYADQLRQLQAVKGALRGDVRDKRC